MLLPDQAGALPHLLVAGGKCSANNLGCFKYILNRDALGGQQTANAGAVLSAEYRRRNLGRPGLLRRRERVQHIVYGGSPLNTYNLGVSPVSLAVQKLG
jgi:hypothetical protein